MKRSMLALLEPLLVNQRHSSLDPVLAKCNGQDILKKSSTRKNRYLVVINAQLAPATAGRLGTLSQLDTKNPVMYLDFPQVQKSDPQANR